MGIFVLLNGFKRHDKMTITISENVAPLTLDRILNYIKQEKIPYTVVPNSEEDEADTLRTSAIRERLRLKYVVSGVWATMDDEDRQDASLLEGMLYDTENGRIDTHSEADTADFYKTY
jgi:ABC-type Zn uptake system ZnuABC Zn-binding protein ZnuA